MEGVEGDVDVRGGLGGWLGGDLEVGRGVSLPASMVVVGCWEGVQMGVEMGVEVGVEIGGV